MNATFGSSFITKQHMFRNAEKNKLEEFCPNTDLYLMLFNVVELFFIVVLVSGIGYFTAIVQKFTILKLKDNVNLSFSHLILEFSIVIVTVLFCMMKFTTESNTLITDICSQTMQFTPDQVNQIGTVYAFVSQTNRLNFSLLVSVIVCQYSLIMIVMLQRT